MIAPIALQALELKDQGISIKVENDKLVITRDDGNDVKINCIYTKDEIDSIITTGTLPNDLQTILLEALNDYIKSNISVNSITWNDKQLSQINITPNDLLNLISTLSANDSNIVKSLQQYTTTNDVETIITDRLDIDTVSFMQSIKDYLENQFLPSYQSKITYLDHIPGPSVGISHFSRFLVISSFFKSIYFKTPIFWVWWHTAVSLAIPEDFLNPGVHGWPGAI